MSIKLNQLTNIVDKIMAKVKDKTDAIEKDIQQVSSQIDEKAKQSDLELQKTRIDNLTTLQEGSTTGDAELIDARVSANGTIYSNVGENIRSIINFKYPFDENIIPPSNYSKNCIIDLQIFNLNEQVANNGVYISSIVKGLWVKVNDCLTGTVLFDFKNVPNSGLVTLEKTNKNGKMKITLNLDMLKSEFKGTAENGKINKLCYRNMDFESVSNGSIQEVKIRNLYPLADGRFNTELNISQISPLMAFKYLRIEVNDEAIERGLYVAYGTYIESVGFRLVLKFCDDNTEYYTLNTNCLGLTGVKHYEIYYTLDNVKYKCSIIVDTDFFLKNNTNRDVYGSSKSRLKNECLIVKNFNYLNNKADLLLMDRIFTIQNDCDGYRRKYAIPVYPMFNDSKKEKQLKFKNGDIKKYFHSNQYQVEDIYNKNEIIEMYCDIYKPIIKKVANISTKARLAHEDIRILIIGDSVTHGYWTDLIKDFKQYWAICAELFKKESIDFKRTDNTMFLGHINYNHFTEEYKGETIEIDACASGIPGWSLNSWLNSTNNFVFTNSNGEKQFSILKWLERYRNYSDDGVKLDLNSEEIGTNITSSNINKIKCCTPNVVFINSTHNGGTIEEHEKIISSIRNEIPNCKIIVGNPMPTIGGKNTSEFYKNKWDICGINSEAIPNIRSDTQVIYWKQREREDENLYYFPLRYITPFFEGYQYDEFITPNGEGLKCAVKYKLEQGHPGEITHRSWGYELYALLKYMFCKDNENVTTNIISVTLDTTEKSLNIEETFTLTATPSKEGTTVVFSSTNENIATVDKTGLVTAVSEGECEIYAETSSSVFPAICKITVNAITESTESSDS